MKRLQVLVVDEDGEIIMHGPVDSYDLRRDYDHYYGSPYDAPVYLPRSSRVEIVCSHVTSGPPTIPNAVKPHSWKPITSLMLECGDCGYRESMVAHVVRATPMPDCPGPKPGLAPGNLSVIVGTPKKPTSYGWTVVKKRDDPQPDRWVKFPAPGGCECGSDKAGLPTHSTWCPRAKT